MEERSVGTIIWVRRRNGSWWPGKIMGCQELSAPRTGATPVQLLGREDHTTSIDWYNLKKSKRVKPFRCGEFDHCIQHAQGVRLKKRQKYASRDHAILHALDLEKQQLCPEIRSEIFDFPVTKPPDATELSKDPTPQDTIQRRSTRVTRLPARLMEYDNHLSPKNTNQRKRPRHAHHHQPTPELPDHMPLQLLLAAADTSDHAPDHLLSEKTKLSPEDEDEEEEDSEAFCSGTESLDSDTYDACLATLAAQSTGRGIDADNGNKQLVGRLQKELLNQKQKNQQMETELVAMKRERDFALSELEELRQKLEKQKGEYEKECEVENAGN